MSYDDWKFTPFKTPEYMEAIEEAVCREMMHGAIVSIPDTPETALYISYNGYRTPLYKRILESWGDFKEANEGVEDVWFCGSNERYVRVVPKGNGSDGYRCSLLPSEEDVTFDVDTTQSLFSYIGSHLDFFMKISDDDKVYALHLLNMFSAGATKRLSEILSRTGESVDNADLFFMAFLIAEASGYTPIKYSLLKARAYTHEDCNHVVIPMTSKDTPVHFCDLGESPYKNGVLVDDGWGVRTRVMVREWLKTRSGHKVLHADR